MTREELLARKKLMDTWLSATDAEKQTNAPVQATVNPTTISADPIKAKVDPNPTRKIWEWWYINNDFTPVKVETTTPDWAIQWKLNDYAKTNPNASAEQITNTIKDQVWYNAKDDEVYNSFFDYYKPKWTTTPTEEVSAIDQHKIDTEKNQAQAEQQQVVADKAQQDKLNKDSWVLYARIANWEIIEQDLQKSPAYKQANQRFTDFNKYSAMTASQVSNAIAWNLLIPWTDVYNDLLKSDPNKIQQAEASATISKMLSQKDNTSDDYQEIISKYILQNFIWDTDSLKNQLSASPEVIRLNDTLTKKKWEVDALKDQIDNAEKDILDELKGTWATTSYKNALVADRLDWLYRQYELKSSDYNTTVWQLQQITDNIKTEYEETEARQAEWLDALQSLYWMQLNEEASQVQSTQTTTQGWTKLNDWTLFNKNTWETKDVWTTTWAWNSVLDFTNNSTLISKYPNEASFKNNNPTWITFWAMSPELKKMFDDSLINYSEWTARPKNEWWNYVKFASVQDWLNAYRIALTQRWDDVYWRLKAWVWTSEWDSYATNLMSQAWINKWDKFSELSEDQMQSLMTAQLKKESPNFYNELKLNESKQTNYTDVDIQKFNSPTFKPQSDLKTESDKIKYKNYLKDKKEVFWSKEANIQDILRYSAWWKDLTDTSTRTLEKFDSALNQIWIIQEQINKMSTWPVIWRLRNMNPYDVDAQTLKAQLTALLPNLARWVYWEVWVLTDNDIKLYSQTIPNLTSTNDVNNAILWMTLKVVAWWYKRQLQSLAAAWKNVSWFSWLYDNLIWQVDAIETWLWIKSWKEDTQKQTITSNDWQTFNAQELLEGLE